ncbi:hypothetical protein E1301_Tti012711 [Triplophysa tibetana]|uniref:Uncharacterized protein n=1 Tax=Triplophysa tibetana TaxID=1572043 RepID=A0A5A9PM05_9TELE|nr:hypothetical protein E1301_Tti012711 [Triplophysa tibetana]
MLLHFRTSPFGQADVYSVAKQQAACALEWAYLAFGERVRKREKAKEGSQNSLFSRFDGLPHIPVALAFVVELDLLAPNRTHLVLGGLRSPLSTPHIPPQSIRIPDEIQLLSQGQLLSDSTGIQL